MSVEELRAGFSRLATAARPAAEPYARLMARRRKRFGLRLTGIAAALLAAAVSAPLTLQSAAPPQPPGPPEPSAIELINWTRRLIDSPTRGTLARDTALIGELRQAFIAKRHEDGVPDDLDQTKILFAADIRAVRHVLAAHYSDRRDADRLGYLVLRSAEVDAGMDGLMNGGAALYPEFDPFFVTVTGAGDTALGLAPFGCNIGTPSLQAAEGVFWGPSSAIGEGEVWRVSCGGKEMQARTVGETTRFTPKPDLMSAYKRLTGLNGAVRWDRNGTTVVAPQSGPGPAIMVLGDVEDGVVALGPPGPTPKPTRTVDRPSPALVGTGNAYADHVVVVRVPQREGGGAVLGNQLLVLGPSGSLAEAFAADGRRLANVGLADGMGYLIVGVGAAKQIKVGSVRFDLNEPVEGERIFGQPLFTNWR